MRFCEWGTPDIGKMEYLDIYEKIGTVVEMIAAQENITFEEAYQWFAESRTYALLQNTNTLMWAESTEYIVDEYYRALGNECC